MRTYLVLWLLACLMPLTVLADEATEAKKFYEVGRLNYDLGRYAEALEAFEKAYAQKPLPGFHFNIGQCKRKLEDYDGAIASFEQYLELMPEASNRKMVEELVAESRVRKQEADALAAAQPAPEESATELAARLAPETAVTPAPESTTAAPEAEAEPSVFETWWFWTAVGGGALVVAAGATTAVLVALNQEQPTEEPSLGRVDLRGVWSW